MTRPATPDTAVVNLPWADAYQAAYRAGQATASVPVSVTLADADGLTLAADVCARSDMPPFPTASVDGYAVRGASPWQLVGRIHAGDIAAPLDCEATAVDIATGAMVPTGAEAILRTEDTTRTGTRVTGTPRPKREWRLTGEEAHRGDPLIPAGTPVTPAVIGIAAAGHDHLTVRRRPRTVVVVLGTELLTHGTPTGGRIRDALGPQLPAWLRRLGADPTDPATIGPVADTPDAHLTALHLAIGSGADLIITTGGTMHGPVDHLHTTLHALDAHYIVDTVAARPGHPMLLATVSTPHGRTLLAGLPGNPQPAIIALLTLAAPALAAVTGRPLPGLDTIELAAPISARRGASHLALLHRDSHGRGHPVNHSSSATLHGLTQAAGFAVIAPDHDARPGDHVPLLALPITPGEHR
jgi:molybdopterin molybdotransferase